LENKYCSTVIRNIRKVIFSTVSKRYPIPRQGSITKVRNCNTTYKIKTEEITPFGSIEGKLNITSEIRNPRIREKISPPHPKYKNPSKAGMLKGPVETPAFTG